MPHVPLTRARRRHVSGVLQRPLMDDPRHSSIARARFYREFSAAVKAIEKLPPRPRPKQTVVDVRPQPETETSRQYPPHMEALKLGYFARTTAHGMRRDNTTAYNESLFKDRNLDKDRKNQSKG